MKNNEINGKIKSAYEKITPDILSSVLADCGQTNEKIIIVPQKRRKNMIKTFTSIAVSAAILLGVGLLGSAYVINNTVSSVVSLDVNPSVEIRINKNEKVLGVNALNEDGKVIVGDMDFSGNSLDVTVNALIGSMLRNGYLSDMTNSILVSVDGKDDKLSAEIRQKVADEISALLTTDDFTGAVLSQTVSADNTLRSKADEYGITAGKAQLIEQITSQNSFYTFEELVPLSINELNLISMSGNLHLENVDSTGKASDKAYIGEDAAKNIAFTHAGVTESEILKYEAELDYENGVMVYDIEFKTSQCEHEYDIDAISGGIVKFDREQKNYTSKTEDKLDKGKNSSDTSAQSSSEYIGNETAKSTAFTHAGVNESDVYECEIELDHEKGVVCYEIDFKCGAYEYEYKIDALTGSVLKYDKEYDEHNHHAGVSVGSSGEIQGTQYIGSDKAKESALAHAGLEESSINKYECKLDREDGIMVYEIEFKSGNSEYEYEIDASTGKIIKYEIEAKD